jgi:transcriptional antiterminator RfaH
MPLLPLEPFVWPQTLFADDAPGAADGRRWWVLHTRPRAEKSLVRRLLRRGLAFFLPLHKRQWRSRGRLLCSYAPLFPGYVFLYADAGGRQAALQTNLIARCLEVADQPGLYADLHGVHRLIVSEAPLTPEERLEPGSPVEIIAGPFAGLQGKVLRGGGQLKLLVEVQFLRRGVSVEIEHWMLQPQSPARPTGTDGARRAAVGNKQ